MVQNSASRQFAFWPDYCIASSKRSLPITVRLIAFQTRDGNIYIYIHTTLADDRGHYARFSRSLRVFLELTPWMKSAVM